MSPIFSFYNDPNLFGASTFIKEGRMKQNRQNHNIILNNQACVAKIPLTGSLNLSGFRPFKLLCDWVAREKHRRHLLKLPDYLLEDIGLTRGQVIEESRRAFWQRGIY